MDFFRTLTGQRAPVTSAGMDENEEMLAEVDDPPLEKHTSDPVWPPTETHSAYKKATNLQMAARRESLLTRQLHSENEHTDEETHHPPRALSTQSTWSTHSTTSTAELTSDDGRSVPSPAISPPLPPTLLRIPLPILEKTLDKEISIVGRDGAPAPFKDPGTKEALETSLARKRCISFACGGKNKEQVKAPSPPPTTRPKEKQASPPKRKCALTFVCPNKSGTESGPAGAAPVKSAASPPPCTTSQQIDTAKVQRDSDCTVTHASPKSVRRAPVVTTSAPTPNITTSETGGLRILSENSDDSGAEATRFHVFGASEDEQEEWVQESTCHRSRLTITDTLKKENVIRKACEEVEEEVIDEEEEEEEDDEEEDEAGGDGAEADVLDNRDDDQGGQDDDESECSDEGFRSDDEEGFGASDDSDADDSDIDEWWRPGGRSTAATSVEHLDRISIQKSDEAMAASSIGSISSREMSPRASRHRFHRSARKARHEHAVPIQRHDTPDLPDSTDFVCGTLDEDRPLEQAYLNAIKSREAAKHQVRPQDIDPTFPTSDPEMDEEDDEDLEAPEESEMESLMHGELDELDGPKMKRRPSPAPKRKGLARSPPPRRHHLPPPPKRRGSPPPLTKRGTGLTKSPPHKLFDHSLQPRRSPPPPLNRTTSSPSSRRGSNPGDYPFINAVGPFCLAQRTHLTHTASLPRASGIFLSRIDDGEGSDTVGVSHTDAPKRGAIDIVKGLERKRQRRREKLYQKACAKAAAKGEKVFKVKPGKGAERMRELGLELQRYHGKGEFILSA